MFLKAFLFSCFFFPYFCFAQNVQKLQKEAQQAYKVQDYASFLKIYQTLDSLRPQHPTILYNLSLGYAHTNNASKAIQALEKLSLINVLPNLGQDTLFKNIQGTQGFQDVVKKMNKMLVPVKNSQEAFRIKEKIHIESVSYDSKKQVFYVGSINKRKIIQIDIKGNISDFTQEGDTAIWAVLGMQIDTKKRVLWAVTTIMPEMLNYETYKTSQNTSKVLKFDLATKKILAEYTLADNKNHFFGDIILHKDGTVYVSDSRIPAIYQIKPKEDKLTLFKETSLRSLQGIALNKQGDKMFLADYASQLYVIDIATKSILPLKIPTNVSTKGTDGLYFWENNLIAIQNGIEPKRITQYTLNKAQTEIISFKVIEANNPLLDEPTLGVLVDDILYYVANSAWGYYEQGQLQTEKLKDIVILKTSLKK